MTRFGRSLSMVLAFVALLLIPAECEVPQLHVNTEGTRIDWCEGDQEVAIAHVHIKLKFVNKGRSSIILSRLLLPQLDIKIYGPSGVVATPIDEYELASGNLGGSPDAERFETIASGASSFREFTVSFFVSRSFERPVHSVPVSGSYSILATLSTWPFWDDAVRANHMKHVWKRYGVLEIKNIKIELSKIEISVPRDLPECTTQKRSPNIAAYLNRLGWWSKVDVGDSGAYRK